MVKTQDLLKLKEGLNQGQSEGFDKLVDFLQSTDKNMFVLRGYAGTGKTFLSSRIIEYIQLTKVKYGVGVSAPTNKALEVLGEAMDTTRSGIVCKTVYQFLGLTEKIDKMGNRTFERDKRTKTIEIENISYLLVDEVSMLNDDLFNKLLPYSNFIKIIFMGDPAQIPPIGKSSCIPFSDNHKHLFVTHELTEIMRQAKDNPIIKLAYRTRTNLNLDYSFANHTEMKDGKGIFILDGKDRQDRDLFKPLLARYFNCEEFRNDPRYCKVIAWRRDSVTYLNNLIRNMIFPIEDYEFDLIEHGKILVGEKLIANSPIFGDKTQSILFNTSSEFEVTQVTEGSVWIKGPHSTKNIKAYNCIVKGTCSYKNYVRKIQILHEDSELEYNIIVQALKQRAIESEGSNQSWLKYYDTLKIFADVNYNYAITAHKAQGSTYKNVIFVESDVMQNPNVVERNQIKYSSYTRPTDNLFIFK